MVMSLANAQAAVAALANLDASALFGRIQGNPHILEKHYDKAKAQTAAGPAGHPQGYFKRATRAEIGGLEDFDRLSANKQRTVSAMIGNPKDRKGISRGLGRYRQRHDGPATVTGSAPVNASSVMDIVHLVLNSGTVELREARGDAAKKNTRFAAVDVIPAGFVGRSIDQAGTKSTAPTYAVVVIAAGGAVNAQIVTAFPADVTYAQGTPLLV